MPLQNEFKVIIGADDRELQSTVRRSQSSLKNLVAGIGIGVGATIFTSLAAGVSKFVGGAVQEFEEAQRSVESLRQSLEAIGREDVFEGIINKSKELAQQFKFIDDDDITSAFQKLIQVGGLTEDAIQRLIPLIIDLNAKQRLAGDTNKTVAATAEDIVKGLNGQGRELKKYGIELKASNTEAKNLSIILEQLGPKVKGASDAFGQSLEGNIAATTIRVQELQEELGGKLLPLKAGLLRFANEVADGFGLLIDRLTLGASKFEAMRDLKVRVDFVQGEAKKKFDLIKDLPLDELTSELAKYQSALDRTNAAVKANKSGEDAINQWKLEAEVVGSVIEQLKKQISLRGDDRKLGSHTKEEAQDHQKVVDALKQRIAALRELIAAGIDVSKNSLKLKDLDIELILRDATSRGLTQAEAQQLIFSKYPDFKGGITLSKPIPVKAKLDIGPSVQTSISQFDAAGDDLSEGLTRMWSRIVKDGEAKGAAAREAIINPFEETIGQGLENAFMNVGESIGQALTGGGLGKAAEGFLDMIGGVLQEVGRQVIIASVLVKSLKAALSKLFATPAVPLAVGVGLVALGAVLKGIKLDKPRKFAEGGVVMGPTKALIGEAGPEAIVPLSRANQFMDSNPMGQFPDKFRVEGTDLVLVMNRTIAQNGRR